MKKIFIFSILFLALTFSMVVSSEGYVINGNIWYNSLYYQPISSRLAGVITEAVYCLKTEIKENCSIHSISARLIMTTYPGAVASARGVIYWDNLSLEDTTEIKEIKGTGTYVFNFPHDVYVLKDIFIYIGIYGQAPSRTGQGVQVYNIVADTTNNYYDIQNNFPNADSTFTSTFSNTGWIASIYANYMTDCDSTDIIFYNNTVNTSGKYEYKYNSQNGFKVWLNFTGITTPFHKYENIINATGTHNYKLNSTGYYIWANYTGNLTPLTLFENIINTTGFHNYILNSSGYRVYANYTGNITPITLFENIINATGFHNYTIGLSGYTVYANYTGNLTGNITGNYTVTINLSSLEDLGFSMNWTGDYNSTDNNISFYVNGDMDILGIGSILSMIVEYDMNQFGLMILMIMSFFFLIVGLMAKDNKLSGFLLILDGILMIDLFVAIVVTFGAVWLLISPGIILFGFLILYYGILKIGSKK